MEVDQETMGDRMSDPDECSQLQWFQELGWQEMLADFEYQEWADDYDRRTKQGMEEDSGCPELFGVEPGGDHGLEGNAEAVNQQERIQNGDVGQRENGIRPSPCSADVSRAMSDRVHGISPERDEDR